MKSIGKMRRFCIGVAGACCFVCLFAHMAGGAPVTSREVREMVVGWQQLSPNPLRTSVGKQISSIRCITNAGGEALYFMVQLQPDGFVLTAADTRIEPILAFSGSGSFVPDPQNPLDCLIRQDLQARLAVLPPDVGSRGGGSVQSEKWKRLQDAAQHPVRGLEAVDDLRVSPLLASTWNQRSVGYGAQEVACYNYYTPPYAAGAVSNYYCGCTATAWGQIMRYFQWPVQGIGVLTNTIRVDGVAEERTTSGTAYDWFGMPDSPTADTPEAERREIGRLLADIGVVCGASYQAGGTSAGMSTDDLKHIFGYSNAVYASPSRVPLSDLLRQALNPNLDAGLVVQLSISRPGGGHAVVCDGYGYNMNTLYHHLNLGWGGSQDAWYQLPDVDAGYYHYTSLSGLTYNLYTNGAGEVVSGRITDAQGLPLESCTVLLQVNGDHFSAVTSSNGVYAFSRVPSTSPCTLTAARFGYQFCTQTVATGLSGYFACGNRGGQDFLAIGTGVSSFVTGRVQTPLGEGLSAVVVRLTNGGVYTTRPDGLYFFEVPEGWSGSVSAAASGAVFEHPVQDVGPVSGPVWNLDFTGKKIWFVDAGAVGLQNGSSWADAFTNLTAACSVAGASSEIWVAEGRYLPEGAAQDSTYFEPPQGVALYGGFAGDETFRTQRNWRVHATILDGDIGVPGVATDNCASVLHCTKEDILIDGFTIQNGGYSTEAYASRGGIYGYSAKSQRVRNCILTGNCAKNGGGAYHVDLENCLIIGNSAGSYGGGTYFCTLNNCTVSGNSAPNGSGVYGGGVTNSIVWPDGVENAATAFCLMVEDPHFRDEAGFDYRLQPDSPCVEAGATVWAAGMQDLYGNPRIIFRQVDIGAYEFTPTNLVCCPVDIHTNWVIDSSDAEQAVAVWKAGLLWNGAELAMDAMTRGYYIVQTGSNYIDSGQSGATRWITAASASTSSGAAVRTVSSGTNVQLSLQPQANAHSFALLEQIPSGLLPSEINPPTGEWLAGLQQIRWVFTNATEQTLSYVLAGGNGTYALSGTGCVDGVLFSVSGDQAIVVNNTSAVIRITTADAFVASTTDVIGVEGDSVNISGLLAISNPAAAYTRFIPATTQWQDQVSLAFGTNGITVSGTNQYGQVAVATCTIYKAHAPILEITNQLTSFEFAISNCVLGGTVGPDVSTLHWTNQLTQQGGTASASNPWGFALELQVGTNPVQITALNTPGERVTDSIDLIRAEQNPVLSVSPSTLHGHAPPNRVSTQHCSFVVRNAGGQLLSYQLRSITNSWITSCTPTGGILQAGAEESIHLTLLASNLAKQTLSAVLSIDAAPPAEQSPQFIPLLFTIRAGGLSYLTELLLGEEQ